MTSMTASYFPANLRANAMKLFVAAAISAGCGGMIEANEDGAGNPCRFFSCHEHGDADTTSDDGGGPFVDAGRGDGSRPDAGVDPDAAVDGSACSGGPGARFATSV